MAKLRPRTFIGPLVVLAFLAFLYFPTFQWLVNSWLHSSYYSHGFLILPIAVFIAWTRRKELRRSTPSRIGIWALVAGLALYVGGMLYGSRFLCALSFLVVLSGLVLYFRGRRAFRALAFPLCFLVFMIPLPFLDTIGFWLQSFSAQSSAWVISQFDIPVTRTGTEIHLGNTSFVVGLPCSGLNSLIALLALAALFAYVLKGLFVKKLMLFIFSVPVAMFANLLRLVGLLLIGNHWGAEAATGFMHTAFSPLFFIVSLVCLAILAKVLGLRFWKPA
ncbi:MAG: exosortase/archaeosortase family protein [Chloroflexota bacterium]